MCRQLPLLEEAGPGSRGPHLVSPDGDRIAVGLEEGLYVIELTRDGEYCLAASDTQGLERVQWLHLRMAQRVSEAPEFLFRTGKKEHPGTELERQRTL